MRCSMYDSGGDGSPGAHLGTLKWCVEPDLDDLVPRTEHALAHGDEARVRNRLGRATDRLRVQFYIPPPGPRLTARPGCWISSQKAVIISSRICSTNSCANAPLRATIPSRCKPSMSESMLRGRMLAVLGCGAMAIEVLAACDPTSVYLPAIGDRSCSFPAYGRISEQIPGSMQPASV